MKHTRRKLRHFEIMQQLNKKLSDPNKIDQLKTKSSNSIPFYNPFFPIMKDYCIKLRKTAFSVTT